jgi:hypothetical protein
MNPVSRRKRSLGLIAAAVGLWLAGVAPSYAATVTAGDTGDPLYSGSPFTGRGIYYNWTVSMSGNDTTAGSTPAITGTVGSLSWNDPFNFGDPIGTGWTHTSNWTALTLTDEAHLSITLAANNSSLVPAFSLYSGHQQTDNGGNFGWHVYNNAGNFDWSAADPAYDSSSLNYIGNATASGTDSSITSVFSLAAGQYSIVFGGNPPPGTAGAQVGYQATLTTSPVPVPAAVYLFGSGLIGLAGLARRRLAA